MDYLAETIYSDGIRTVDDQLARLSMCLYSWKVFLTGMVAFCFNCVGPYLSQFHPRTQPSACVGAIIYISNWMKRNALNTIVGLRRYFTSLFNVSFKVESQSNNTPV